MKNLIMPFIGILFLSGCSELNTVYQETPKIEKIHPVRQNQIYVPDNLSWTAININNQLHFAISLDEQVALFRFMESVILYKKESEEMLCYYENPTECDKIESKKEKLKDDESRIREKRN